MQASNPDGLIEERPHRLWGKIGACDYAKNIATKGDNRGQQPFRFRLAEAERATRCKKRVVKRDMVLLEKRVRSQESGGTDWNSQAIAKSPCKVPVSRVSCCIGYGDSQEGLIHAASAASKDLHLQFFARVRLFRPVPR